MPGALCCRAVHTIDQLTTVYKPFTNKVVACIKGILHQPSSILQAVAIRILSR